MSDESLVLTDLSELVRPKHTALIVIDLQNDICLSNGAIGKMDYDPSIYDFSVFPPVFAKLKPLLETARKAGVMVIHAQLTRMPGGGRSFVESRMALRIYKQTDPKYLPRSVVEGTWGHEFVEEVRPISTDIVIKKTRNSAFVGTPLDMLLRSNNIRTLVITGCQTDGCVESTARDASSSLGYFSVIVKDCVASYSRECHEAMVKVFERRFDVVTSREIINAWKET